MVPSTLLPWKVRKNKQRTLEKGSSRLQDWVQQGSFMANRKQYPKKNEDLGVSLNGGTPKTPQNDHF